MMGFAIPGMGRLLYDAVVNRDIPAGLDEAFSDLAFTLAKSGFQDRLAARVAQGAAASASATDTGASS